MIDADGVSLKIIDVPPAYTPSELRHLSRWLNSLAGEAEEASRNGHISHTSAFNVATGQLVERNADG